MHAIGSPEGVTLLEFEPERQEEQQAAQEQEVQAEGGVNLEDLPKCLDHQPSSFLKGKPWSILSLLCFLNINLSPFMLMHHFWDFCEDRCISVKYVSVAHPRANVQVERANGMILDALKKRTSIELRKNT